MCVSEDRDGKTKDLINIRDALNIHEVPKALNMHDILNENPLVIPILTLGVLFLRLSSKEPWQLNRLLANYSYVI